MHAEHKHCKSLFFKVVGPAKGTEQWKMFNLSKLQSLYLKVLLLSNGVHLFCNESHSGPKEVIMINQNLKGSVADMEAPLPHKYRS